MQFLHTTSYRLQANSDNTPTLVIKKQVMLHQFDVAKTADKKKI